MRNENFYVVQGWMMSELGLSGNELICYAVIFGATQGGQTVFKESRTYLSEWMNATLPTVDKCLKSLVEKKYLVKHTEIINGVKFNMYRAVSFDFITHKESLVGGSKESLGLTNNTNNKITNEIDSSISQSDKELFEKCWLAYRRKGKKGKSLPYWNKLTQQQKQAVMPHIKAYVSSRDLQYQQDFERYLRDKTFLSIVTNKNIVVYDPAKTGVIDEKIYAPTVGGALNWNDYYSCFMYVGYWDGKHIPDGYDDDTRPDGASVTLNNGRGTLVWSVITKTWNKV